MTENTEKVDETKTEKAPEAPAPKAANKPKASKPRSSAAKPKASEAKEKKSLPLATHNDSFYLTLDENANGVPTVSVLPVGWVGAAPLQISEAELDDLIKGLQQLRR